MKSGLKLLVELNTLVWTSKQEAEAALKAAADKARAAELAAANAANVATKAAGPAAAMGVTGGASWTAGNKTGEPAFGSTRVCVVHRAVKNQMAAVLICQRVEGFLMGSWVLPSQLSNCTVCTVL
jgi:hypothetical protein